MKNIFFGLCGSFVFTFFSLGNFTTSYAQSLRSFDLTSVRLEAGPFYDAQQTDLRYMLQLDVDRLLVPFLIDARIPTTSERYGNWENTGLDGHIGGHYLSALAHMYASTKDAEVLKRLNYMIDKLAECQQKNGNGYVGGIPGGQAMWKEISEGKIKADNFSLNQKWVPLYNIHKLFAGLRDAYVVGEQKKAWEVFIKLCDWFVATTATLTDEQIQQMLRSEHGGLNEIFADAFALTNDKKYLVVAKKLSHKKILDPLVNHKDELTGLHANTQIPKVIGFKRIADVSKDSSWSSAANFFWETVIDHRTVSIGGNSVREHFHPVNDFSSMIESNQGPETCNTYNMLRLSKALFLSQPDVRYLDYYERGLYNHILSSQHPQGGFVYFTPMRPRHYRVYSQPQESFWCCVGSGLENHAKYGELIYAHTDKDIFVNLFIASSLVWKEKGITITQKTKFPFEETSSLTFALNKPQSFTLHVRYPSWVKAGHLKIQVNGKEQKVTATPSSLIQVKRTWKHGDVVLITLPMQTNLEFLPDSSSWGSLVHGPIVLAAATDSTDLVGLKSDGSRMGHVAEGNFYAIEKAPVLINQDNRLLQTMKKIPSEPLAFTAASSIYPKQYENVKLVPFFTLHDVRYMVYWKVTTRENLDAMIVDLREKEQKVLVLQERTIDQVAAGEQQPETEHNFKGEETDMGNTYEQRWRIAKRWFSYDLKDTKHQAKVLRVTYVTNGKNRKYDILLNDKVLKTVVVDDNRSENTAYTDYELPSEATTASILNVKFRAHQDSSTGRIVEVRLLK